MKKIYILLTCCLVWMFGFAQITDSISFSVSQLEISIQGDYTMLSFEGCSFVEEVGAPQLPYYKFHYLVPIDKRVAYISLSDTLFVSQRSSNMVFPAQPNYPMNETPPDFVEPDSNYYSSVFPNHSIEIEAHGFMKGYHVVTVNIFPVQYIGTTNMIKVATSMKFTLHLEDVASQFKLPKMQSSAMTKLVKKQIQGLVRNHEQINEIPGGPLSVCDTVTPSLQILNMPLNKYVQNHIPEYLIITNNTYLTGAPIPLHNGKTMTDIFQELADWKTQKGVPTAIVTLDEIVAITEGYDVEEKIHNFLKTVYENWGTLFVLFGGDVNIIPSRFVTSSIMSVNFTHLSDLYFTAIENNWNANGNDIFGEGNDFSDSSSEFWYGRALADSCTDAQVFVNKVLNYEKMTNITNTDYVNNLLFVAGYYDETDPTPIKEINNIVTGISLQSNINIKRLYDNPHLHSGDDMLNRRNFIDSLNVKQFHVVYHHDHSDDALLGASAKIQNQYLSKTDMNSLFNNEYTHILYTHGCNPGEFDKDCIIKHYLNNPTGGGVASVASSTASLRSEHKYFKSFTEELYQTTSGNPTTSHIGIAHDNSILPTLMNTSYKRKNHLFGDPEMPIWTRTPDTLKVSYTPAVVTNTNNQIVVTVDNLVYSKDITVCLFKDKEIYERLDTSSYYGQGGTQVYVFNVAPQTAGNITLTVTGHNYLPFQTNIPVTISGKNIYISDTQIIDNTINGNNNQKIDAGETVNMNIQLKNNGTVILNGVSATLSCLSNDVTMLTSYSSYGNISINGTASSAQFQFKVSPEIKDGAILPFKLVITDNSGYSVTRFFNCQAHAPVLKFEQNYFSLTGNHYELFVQVNNRGSGDARSVTANLSSQNIAIINPVSSYGTILPYSLAQNVTAFKIPGSYTNEPLKLTLTDYYGKTTSKTFQMITPSDTINNITFKSTENSITLYWSLMANYKGYNVYRSDADAYGEEVGNYIKLNTLPLPFAFYNDLGLPAQTKYYYKISAVCQEGNEGALSAPFPAMTIFVHKKGFPVTMSVNGSIKGSVNVEDIDGDGKKEIFTSMSIDSSNGLLIGLKYNGTELFNLDGNANTFTGLAQLNAATECTPAIGDINNDGIYEIISMTQNREMGGQNYFYCHTLHDGNGDGAPDLLWQKSPIPQGHRAPILANIDNSPDGSLESVFYSENGGIYIYKANGQPFASNQIDCPGKKGAIAVADLDGCGYREIIAPVGNGIAVWKYNSTTNSWVNYGTTQPFFTLPNYDFSSSIIVCDIDNDGDKEILTTAYLKIGTWHRKIIVVHHDGSIDAGWDSKNTIIDNTPYAKDTGNTRGISVGDLNNDGKLEVVAFGSNNRIKIWDNLGNLIKDIGSVWNLNFEKSTPILADVDGDPDLEIIFGTTDGLIHALKMDGSKALGFPLQIGSPLEGSPCVADIDNNGKNELIAASGNKIYVWETAGNANRIEWGSERHNCRNTGEYNKQFCSGDLIISTNTTWTTDQAPCANIIVVTGTTLTVESTIYMNSNGKITIQPGGKLVVDGGIITSASSGTRWQGITVMGDSTKPLLPLHQGYVQIINNSTIENAVCGIIAQDGGIIETTDAYFRNNTTDIKFKPVASGQSGRSGTFNQTVFALHHTSQGEEIEPRLIMDHCGEISVTDCSFVNPLMIPVFNGIEIYNTATLWDGYNMFVSVPIFLHQGATLTNTGTISSFGASKLTVHPCSKLIVDGGTLTNAGTEMWYGVVVMGDSSQLCPNPSDNVYIINNGAISNAVTGITVYGGGRVTATDAIFENNQTGIHFKPLAAPQTGNAGTFSQTSFVQNSNYLGNLATFDAHLRMDSCGHVAIEDCEFSTFSKINPSNGIVVSNASTTWTGTNQLYVPVDLYENATLTHTGTSRCNMSAIINVYAGGNLIIDGGTLSGGAGKWQGISVQGYTGKPSLPGMVSLQNGGTIENALLGIHALAGGKVEVNDAYFINNKVGVQMEQGSLTADFTNTRFTVNYNYLGNYLDFDAHLKLFNGKLTKVLGCTFLNETFVGIHPTPNPTPMPTENIGIQVFNSDFSCSYSSTFSGFCTAISVSNSGLSPSVSITGNTFSNNLCGVGLNAVNYLKVRDNQFDMNRPYDAMGLYSKQSTGYFLEENLFFTDDQVKTNTTGIMIEESGVEHNVVSNNSFHYTNVGIQAIGQNSDQDSVAIPVKGLEFLCNQFNKSQATDILVGSAPWQSYSGDHSVNWSQGNLQRPAGNEFHGVNKSISNYSNYRIRYYYSTLVPAEYPASCVGYVDEWAVNLLSGCSSHSKQAGIDLEQALAQYDAWNAEYEYWLAQLHAIIGSGNEMDSTILHNVSYYSALKDNYLNTIIVAVMEEANEKISPSNFEGVPEGRGSLYETLRFLFSYRNHYTDNLSIIETFIAENNYEEALATITKIYRQFKLNEKQNKELAGLQTYIRWLQELNRRDKSIYALSDSEIEYLLNYIETNTGRGTVFAHNILCALYKICPEAVGGVWYEVSGGNAEIPRYTRNDGEKSPSNITGVPEGRDSLYENITIYPNPTTGELEIRNYESEIKSIEVFDVYGRAISSHHLIPSSSHQKINLSHINSGIYFVKITTEASEVVKKVVKQ